MKLVLQVVGLKYGYLVLERGVQRVVCERVAGDPVKRESEVDMGGLGRPVGSWEDIKHAHSGSREFKGDGTRRLSQHRRRVMPGPVLCQTWVGMDVAIGTLSAYRPLVRRRVADGGVGVVHNNVQGYSAKCQTNRNDCPSDPHQSHEWKVRRGKEDA